ncbi:MAG: FAD binding domain-containing protein [Actinomycetota bacterium]
MFPARFEYAAPTSIEEALSLLTERGDEAKVLAGGQSLIPLMKLRFAAPGLIVDLNRIPGLGFIEESDGGLRIGALTRHAELVDSDVLRDGYPTMATAAPLISDPIVRNLGTIGGSLAHADPAGDWASVMLALGGEVVARSASGERTIPVGELIEGPFTTTLRPDEVLTEVRVPAPQGPSGGTYLKLERKVGDFATVGVAVQVSLDDGRIGSAGLGLTAVGPQNIKPTAAEEALARAEPSEEAFQEAGRLAAEAASPTSDVRGSADYKREVVRAYVARGLSQAVDAARAG